MDARLVHIRESEKKSHTEMYTNEQLYKTDSWLQKPIKTVQEIIPLFSEYEKLRVLDLGCGIGRNAICIAERFKGIDCIVDCVDLLDIAIEKLWKNAKEHDVSSHINGIHKAIEYFEINTNTYDFIMAVSALEHVDTEEAFLKKLMEIRDGLRTAGIVCLVINSDVREINSDTKAVVDAQFEVNLPTEIIQAYLNEVFKGWNVLKSSVREQEYDIPRENFTSHLTTKVVTFVARKGTKY